MNILDANIIAGQRDLLARWRIPFRQIGRELAHRYDTDDAIVPQLLRLKAPAFFTRDRDFWKPALCHPALCFVWLDVPASQAARYIRAFLRHPAFKTRTARLGKVVHVHTAGIVFYRERHAKAEQMTWLRAV